MTTTILGVFSAHADAEKAIGAIRALGVPESDISYVYMNRKGDLTDGQEGRVGDGAATGATTGAVVGAIAGLVVANGILPGLGTLFVAGPLAAALGFTGAVATTVAGAATGAAAGGFIGALSNIGVSTEDAALYEGIVRRGDILVTVHSKNPVGVAVEDVLRDAGAKEIRLYTVS